MVRDVIAAASLLLLIIATKIKKTPPERPQRPLIKKYVYWVLEKWMFVLVFFLLDPEAFHQIDFNVVGRGVALDLSDFAALIGGLIVSIVSGLISPQRYFRRKKTEEELYSVFAKKMPNTSGEFAVFVGTVIALVVSEELLFRQFLFSSFYHAFHLQGDLLLLVSAVLFTVAHNYKKILPISMIFVTGLIFGKSFQVSGGLLYPIILHLLINAHLVVKAIHRMRAQKRILVTNPTGEPMSSPSE